MFANSAFSQNDEDLNRLIFDPILIQIEIMGANEGEEQLRITELSSLQNAQAPSPNLSDKIDQTTQESSYRQSIKQYELAIQILELDGGAHEEKLSQELLGLGNIYYQQGDQQKAREAYNKALHINRINKGLFNAAQEPIVQKIVRSYLASRDIKAANARQEYLFYILRKEYGNNSPELMSALEAYANWNMLAFNLSQDTHPINDPANSTYLNYSDSFTDPLELQNFQFNRLIDAQNTYQTINQILSESSESANPKTLEIEQNLVLSNYMFATRFLGYRAYNDDSPVAKLSSKTMGERLGRQALERSLEYLSQMKNISPEALFEATTALGDWAIMFKRRSAALAHYQKARQALLASEVPEAQINDLIHPELPVPIPTFLAKPYTRAAYEISEKVSLSYQGHIDLEFRTDRLGTSHKIKILGETPNTSSAVKSILVSTLRQTQFRPRVIDDQLVKDDLHTIRYYYSY